jgi:hypothetical protein
MIWADVPGLATASPARVARALGLSRSAVLAVRAMRLVPPDLSAALVAACLAAGVEPPPLCDSGHAVLEALDRRRLARELRCATWTGDSAAAWARRALEGEA